MNTTSTLTAVPRRLIAALGMAVLALALAAMSALTTPGAARADTPPAADPAPTLQFSADGKTWGGANLIPWSQDALVPGHEVTTTFQVKNISGKEGDVFFYVGNYKISTGMKVSLRVDVNDAKGKPVAVTDAREIQPGTQMNLVHLKNGQTAKVSFVVAMPADAGNETQNGTIDPDWAIDFEATPGNGGGNTTPPAAGSSGFGSLTDLFGKLIPTGSSTGSLGK
ncbi:hypothetical protein [Speluncibacter jeojiensis]|uniref:DUF4352 domain-containing protein n=1 Tax=Speluncibacter jeojiensis TaxID=2710754 RepID=A0A9X4M008_9ACTN|nr:hypothetical protein [Corynebacteriales bacterium D3-21]